MVLTTDGVRPRVPPESTPRVFSQPHDMKSVDKDNAAMAAPHSHAAVGLSHGMDAITFESRRGVSLLQSLLPSPNVDLATGAHYKPALP